MDPRKFKPRHEAEPPSVEETAMTADFAAANPPLLNLGEKGLRLILYRLRRSPRLVEKAELLLLIAETAGTG